MISILFILIISLGFFYYDFFPTLRPYFQTMFKNRNYKKIPYEIPEQKIVDVSINMIRNNEGDEFWSKKSYNLTKKIVNLFNQKANKSLKEFRTLNYPKAFLLLGILLYLRKTNDNKRLLKFKKECDIIFEKIISHSITRIDQSPFGTVAIILFEMYKEDKYLKFSEKILDFIYKLVDAETGLIKYRKNSNIYFNDTLGMAITFLVEYSTITGNTAVLDLCKKQMDYFNLYGINSNTNIPMHGVNWEKNNTTVGSANWGRGIGWYFYGLITLNNKLKIYNDNIKLLEKSLLELRNPNKLWSQFPGSSERFDSSTTTMILASLAISKNQNINFKDNIKQLMKVLDKEGYILDTSGDTIGLNNYSNSFGKSDLSQGFLLILLSHFKI